VERDRSGDVASSGRQTSEIRADQRSKATLALVIGLGVCALVSGFRLARLAAEQATAAGLTFPLCIVGMGYCAWHHAQNRQRQLFREVVAHQRAIADLEASEQRFRFITESTGDVIWTLDLSSWKCSYVSPAISSLRGYQPDEFVGKAPEAFLSQDGGEKIRATIAESIVDFQAGNTRRSHVVELDQPHKNGRIVPTEVVVTLRADEFGQPKYVLGVTRDITERRRSESAIRSLAYYDGLTQLPNRRMLSDRLQQALARAVRDGSRIALLFMDLDNFKPVNDELGHEVGDWLLQSTAQRMLECLRPYDTAARIGGDEFAILLSDLHSPEEALAVAERLRLSLQSVFLTPDGRRIQISSSIGVALYPDHAHNERDLLRVGDEAMYRAKKGGRNNVFILPPEAPRNFTPLPSMRAHASTVRLNWSPAYCSGDPVLDAEHKNLFKLANALLDQCATPDVDINEVTRSYEYLVAHIEKHFREEEAQMERWGYAKTGEHAEVHRHLLQRADELHQQLNRQSLSLGDFVEFIAMDVVAKHMLKYDREYFSFAARDDRSALEAPPRTREEPSRPGHATN
jgi:diguanylate cyclase (GGDEF)-like protein/hemerythrin-like metal-binding protein/PAS domain S-box-containing protein